MVLLKQVIEYYQTNFSPEYLRFIDRSKAFDRIDHATLFRKLQKYDLPTLVIMVLQNWYTTQNVYVQRRSAVSECFQSVNGVRQGGILSPLLFCIYVDERSVNLYSVPYACCINSICINHLRMKQLSRLPTYLSNPCKLNYVCR